MLRAKAPDTSLVVEELRHAVAESSTCGNCSGGRDEGSEGHEAAEDRTIERSLPRLHKLIDDFDAA